MSELESDISIHGNLKVDQVLEYNYERIQDLS